MTSTSLGSACGRANCEVVRSSPGDSFSHARNDFRQKPRRPGASMADSSLSELHIHCVWVLLKVYAYVGMEFGHKEKLRACIRLLWLQRRWDGIWGCYCTSPVSRNELPSYGIEDAVRDLCIERCHRPIEGKIVVTAQGIEGKPSCGRFWTQSCPIGPNLCSNDVTDDGDS